MKYIRHDRLGFILWHSIGGQPRHSDVARFFLTVDGPVTIQHNAPTIHRIPLPCAYTLTSEKNKSLMLP
jgi:hypothetical protein